MVAVIPPGRRLRWRALVAAAAVCGAWMPAGLSAQETAPELVSRTGGGDAWSNPAELQAAAEQGNPRACAQLGEILLRGGALPQDGPRALALLESAARAGEAAAAFRIGMLLDDGIDVAQDRIRALAYFRAAAAGGETEAFHNVGAAYASARGVRRDYAEALGWLILATKKGDESGAEAQLRTHLAARHPAELAAGERRGEKLERRRIMPEEYAGRCGHGELLRGENPAEVECRRCIALKRQMGRRPEGDEVVAERLAEKIDHRDGRRDDADGGGDIGRDRHARINAQAVGIEQNVAGSAGHSRSPSIRTGASLERRAFQILYQCHPSGRRLRRLLRMRTNIKTSP